MEPRRPGALIGMVHCCVRIGSILLEHRLYYPALTNTGELTYRYQEGADRWAEAVVTDLGEVCILHMNC